MTDPDIQDEPESTIGRKPQEVTGGPPRASPGGPAPVRLALVGDVMLGRLVNVALATGRVEHPWGDVLPVLRAADAFVLNLECVLSDRGEPVPGKMFVFRSDLKNVEVLERAGATAVSLANNHALDFGSDALEDCLAALASRGIQAAGAGRSAEQARRPAFFPAGGLTAALVAFTDNEPDWEAKGTTPGVFHVPVDPDDGRFLELLEVVRGAAGQADLVIASAHWGTNWGEAPPAPHAQAARMLIDAGADVVFGHSAHVFRGVGFHRGKPILYSCGDFVDDYAVDEIERNDQSFVFQLEYDGRSLRRLVLVPTVIRHFQARLARGRERAEMIERIWRLSHAVGTTTGIEESADGLEIVPPPPVPQAEPWLPP
jgi:poly-gamma-glutamate synthesis protein (capsule biosynthesis protein)